MPGKINFKKIFVRSLLVILLLAVAGLAYFWFAIYEPPLISEEDRAQITLMPLPAKLALTGGDVSLINGITPSLTENNSILSQAAIERWVESANIKLTTGGIPVSVRIVPVESEFDGFANESYELEVSTSGIDIRAADEVGVIYAFETLRQLQYEVDGQPVLPTVKVEDKPRFPYRGLMVDVSRHFIPQDVILRLIESMAAVKMNVFHWHLSDDQGFRVESKTFPLLHEVGSNGAYYTQDEIREVIEFARLRGIRIIPEFDLPGHSKSWQLAYPQYASLDEVPSFGFKNGLGFSPPVDPTNEDLYVFLDAFIQEMGALFPDPYFHIGGDEVNPTAWEENGDIQVFMADNGMRDHHDLQAYFISRVHEIFKRHDKIMLGWDEILNPDLSSEVIVQSWTSHKSLFEAVQQGGTAILSAGFYLDHILPASKHYEVDPLVLPGRVDIEPDTTFWKMYDQTVTVGGNIMESQLVIFDRDPENVFGYFAMLSDRMPFKGGKLENGNLSFKMNGPVGEMSYSAQLNADTLTGEISLGLLSLESSGFRSGGSDMPGTEMPEIETMRPLTPEEEARIIGGEACQWAEFVDGENVESRIWPRAAAIAEKLWSPASLTTDTEDMYRRLAVTSVFLESRGSRHEIQFQSKLSELIPAEGLENLLLLSEYLEEVKYHGRMPDLMFKEEVYLPEFKLDRLVDAVRPESLKAREFNNAVDRFIEDGNEQDKAIVGETLKSLAANDVQLEKYYADNEKLEEVSGLSRALAAVSIQLLAKLEDNRATALTDTIQYLETGENGLIVAIAPGLKKLDAME